MDAVYLAFDTETGGVFPETSLLSAHFAVCDKEFNILEELDLLTKPNDDRYVVTAQGLSVNKIDLISHDQMAITYSQAGSLLRDFLQKTSNGGKFKLIPMGKNIQGDIQKITDTILGPKNWNQYVSYKVYEITTTLLFLKRTGRLEADCPESLKGAAEYFGINENWHTSRGDNIAGIKLVKALEKL